MNKYGYILPFDSPTDSLDREVSSYSVFVEDIDCIQFKLSIQFIKIHTKGQATM